MILSSVRPSVRPSVTLCIVALMFMLSTDFNLTFDHRGFYHDFGRVPGFSAIAAVILHHGRENQRTVCNFII